MRTEGSGDAPEEKAAQKKVRSARKKIASRIAFVLLFLGLTLSGTIIGVTLLGRSVYRWHGFEIEMRLLPATQGETRLVLTPLGEVRAHTHLAPVSLIATLTAIDVDDIQKLVKSTPTRDALAKDFETQARSDLTNFIARQALAAALGALLAPLLLNSRRARYYVLSSVIGTAILGSALVSAISTFKGDAFATPVYTGTLKEAPWVIQFGKDAFSKVEALSTKLVTVATNLNVLYGRIAALPERLDREDPLTTFRILHVSDLHNNLAALDFIRQVATQFKVSFIVDTGDLTDFGSPPEIVMVRGIEKLPYPYVFVAGNHDSKAVLDALSKVKNVTVLNGQEVTVEGVTLIGLPNPASARAGVGSVDTTPLELQAGGEMLLTTIKALPAPPDIVAVHDPEESRPLWGQVPLVLCGHEHRFYIQQPVVAAAPNTPTMPTILCNAGTTGAAGLRYFEKEKGVPFSCAVLTFDRAPLSGTVAVTPPTPNLPTNATAPAPTAAQPPTPRRPTLRSIDLISLDGSLGQYSISHSTYNAPPATLTAGSPPAP